MDLLQKLVDTYYSKSPIWKEKLWPDIPAQYREVVGDPQDSSISQETYHP